MKTCQFRPIMENFDKKHTKRNGEIMEVVNLLISSPFSYSAPDTNTFAIFDMNRRSVPLVLLSFINGKIIPETLIINNEEEKPINAISKSYLTINNIFNKNKSVS